MQTTSRKQQSDRARLAFVAGIMFAAWSAFFWWWLPSQPQRTIQIKDAPVQLLDMSPDGTVLAVLKEAPIPAPQPRPDDPAGVIVEDMWRRSHLAGQVQLWRASEGTLQAALATNIDDIEHVGFSPDGSLLAITGKVNQKQQHCVQLWLTATGQEYATLHPSPAFMDDPIEFSEPTTFRFSPDGQTIVYSQPGKYTKYHDEAGLWDVPTRRDRAWVPRATFPFAFAPDSRTLATACHRWRPTAEEGARYVGQKLLGLGACALQPGAPLGRLILILDPQLDMRGMTDHYDYAADIVLWDVASGRVRLTLERPKAATEETPRRVRALSFSPDSRELAALLEQGWPRPPAIVTWDSATGKPTAHHAPNSLRGQSGGHSRMRYMALDKCLLIDLYEPLVGDAHLLCELTEQATREADLVLDRSVSDPDGARLAVSTTGSLRGFGRAIAPFLAEEEQKKPPPAPAVHLVDAATLQAQEFCRPRWRGSLRPLTFSPDGRRLAIQYIYDIPGLPEWSQPFLTWAMDREGLVRLYEVPTGKLLGTADGRTARFTPDNKMLITSGGGAIRLFDLPLQSPVLPILVRSAVATAVVLIIGLVWRAWRLRRTARILVHS